MHPTGSPSRLASRRTLRRFGSDSSGITLVMFAIGAVAILGLVGLAIDGSRTFLERNQFQQAVDTAVLSAATTYDRRLEGGADFFTAYNSAIDAAEAMFAANYRSRAGGADPNIRFSLVNADVPHPLLSFGGIIDGNVRTTFGRVAGTRSLSPSAFACAAVDPVSNESKLVPCATGGTPGTPDTPPSLCTPVSTRTQSPCTARCYPGAPARVTGTTTITDTISGCGHPIVSRTVQACSVNCPPPPPPCPGGPGCPVPTPDPLPCVYEFTYNFRADQGNTTSMTISGGTTPACIQGSRSSDFDALNRVYYVFHIMNKVFAGNFFDEQFSGQYRYFLTDTCQIFKVKRNGTLNRDRLNSYRLCGNFGVQVVVDPSPLSLLWTADADPSASLTHVSFPLRPDAPAGARFEWRASATAPLVVYDPEHTGKVTRPEQLFGNHTFGRQWANGYEALASLDADRDGKLSGKELDPLALWFDANRDGVSGAGEVKPVRDTGVTAIHTAPDRTDPRNGWIHASRGYDRKDGDTTVTLPSVDWFGRELPPAAPPATAGGSGGTGAGVGTATPAASVGAPAGNPKGRAGAGRTGSTASADAQAGSPAPAAPASAPPAGGGAGGSTPTAAAGGGGSGGGSPGTTPAVGGVTAGTGQPMKLPGLWVFAVDPEKPSASPVRGDGYLSFEPDPSLPGTIKGQSRTFVAPPSAQQPSPPIVTFPLAGVFEGGNAKGEQGYSFLATRPDSEVVTKSRAIVSADGKTLTGTSTTTGPGGDKTYTWTATKAAGQP